MTDLVPADFAVPRTLTAEGFRLEPLGGQHNASDLAAWSSSIDHIHATPGWTGSWPPAEGMTPEQNLADLRRHAADFERRSGFTYTVLETPGDAVVGCVYIHPDREDPAVAKVSSWVRADRAELDAVLHRTVSAWLAEDWPLGEVRYAAR
ncbi:N-acetyltransferase [Streptomyces sp. CB01881]|uniref:GNAT family N-acetyltransferase n=1 Tax=Streptomyces sp. CB01881 TaxID=2078691 RepID=UPI000CDCA76C|nr:N-acetyltransferase [Streptomyces sp. CB01881]AUY52900.1 twin-arginine translocation pathway signal protein [Streptomyces sp. CB01881]TYC70617.1 N-acetyltransferase [Streptomyces sp. CB01881]